MSINEIKAKILPVLRKYEVSKAGLFGSAARGQESAQSDIDILVELKKDLSLLDFVGLKQELEQTLGRKVDLVEYQTIKPLLKDRRIGEELGSGLNI